MPRTDFLENKKTEPEREGAGERKSSSEEGRIQDTLRGLKAGGLQERARTHTWVGAAGTHSMAPSAHFGHPGAANPAPNKALGKQQRLGGGHRPQRPPCSWWLLVPGSGQSTVDKTDPEGQGAIKGRPEFGDSVRDLIRLGEGLGGKGTKAVLLSSFLNAITRGPASANVRKQLHLGAGTKPRAVHRNHPTVQP